MSEAAPVERMIEALLFAAAEPLSIRDLRERLARDDDIEAALAALQARYSRRGVRLAQVGERWRFETAPDLAFLMTREREAPRRLSRAAQETLAIIAYHQPVTRAEIEAIRGVQAGRGVLDALIELRLIRMRGRRRSPGRPVAWGTTAGFLEHYGLASLADLPGEAEMRAAGLASSAAGPPPPGSADEALDDASEFEPSASFHQDYLCADDAGMS